MTARLNDLGVTALGDLTLAFGVNSPFGSLTRWPNDGPFRTAVTFVTLPLVDIKPTIAYRLNDQWSFGIGADIYTFSSMFGEGQAERKFVWPGGLGIPPGSQMELSGKDTAAGFNVSAMYTPFRNEDGRPLTQIGLVYRSQATLHLGGSLLANGGLVSDAKATLVLPQVFSFGAAIWPVSNKSREWKWEFDADYVGWKSVRNLDVTLSSGVVIPQPQNWQSGYSIMIGTEYRMLQLDSLPGYEMALRAGYTNQQTQMPDATFDPGIASAHAHIPSVGIGFLCKDQGHFLGIIPCGKSGGGAFRPHAIGFDLSFQIALYEDRTIAGNRNPTVNGLYTTTIPAGGVSFRLNF
jgi:long-chain fatty acid transport protein